MEPVMQSISFWYWWILAVALLIVEVAVSGFFFLWMAAAAAIVGLLLYLWPALEWEYQFGIFSVLSVLSIVAFRRFQLANPPESDQPALNRRGEQYIGRVFTLAEPLRNGIGTLHVDDTMWRVSGPDLATGSQVRVVGVSGVMLVVEAA